MIGDIVVIDQRVLPAGEGLVGDDTDIVGVVDQGIARDAAGGLIGLAEAAVDDDQLAAALDGALALFRLDGDVPIDDMAVRSGQAKFLQQHIADSWVVIPGVVSVFRLVPGRFVGD